MKIVINSNVRYKKPLAVLLQSIYDSGFQAFENIIIVMSQSAKNTPPMRVNAQEFIPDAPNIEICLIEITMNSFDFTGFHSLYIYSEHPLIKTDYYLYLLDTCTVDLTFAEKYNNIITENKIIQIMTTYKEIDIISYHHPIYTRIVSYDFPQSSIFMFDKYVILNYQNNFSIPLTKREGLSIEDGKPIIKRGRVIKPLKSFGQFTSLGQRIRTETKDIYNTKYPRTGFYYPRFGITKWILLGQNGDFTGKVKPN